jgi:glycosyltransferase involved in cell wall biosynthesis
MLRGVPVVATPVAMEGMFGENGKNCLIADNASAFADHVARLDSDCHLWSTLVAGGRQTVREHFSYEKARASLQQLFRQLSSGPKRQLLVNLTSQPLGV